MNRMNGGAKTTRSQLTTAAILIAAACVLVFANSLNNGFVWDDHFVITERDFYEDAGNVKHLFDSEAYFPDAGQGTYRLMMPLTLFLDHVLWGKDAYGYHLTNLVLHIAGCFLFYLFMASLAPAARTREFHPGERDPEYFRYLTIPLLAALFYAVHPLQPATVSYIQGRHALLMSLFYFSGLIFCCRSLESSGPRRLMFYLFSLSAYFLSCLSKETGITLPVSALLMYYMFYRGRQPVSVRALALSLAGFAAVGCFFLYVRFFAMSGPENLSAANVNLMWINYPAGSYGGSYYTNLLNLARNMFLYIGLMAAPVKLSSWHFMEPYSSTVTDPAVLISLLTLALVAAFFIRYFKRLPLLCFAIAWFFITVLPVSNLVFIHMTGEYASERYLHLPLAGFCIFLAGSLSAILSSDTGKRSALLRKGVAGFAAVLLFFYGIRTIARNRDWKNDVSLWSSAVEAYPESYMAHYWLGGAYHTEKDALRAEEHLRTSIGLKDLPQARNDLGVVYLDTGRYDEAIEQFEKVLEYYPKKASALYLLGKAYYEKGDYTKGREVLEKAAAAEPERPDIQRQLALVYLRQGLYPESEKILKEILKTHPDDALARYALANIYFKQKRFGLSEQEYKKVLERDPHNISARNNLGNLYFMAGRVEDALGEYRKVLERYPAHLQARNNMANIYLSKGMYDEAIREYGRVLDTDPDNAVVYYNRGLAYEAKGMIEKARQEWRKAVKADPGLRPARDALDRTDVKVQKGNEDGQVRD